VTYRGELVLSRGDFAVACAQRDADLEALVLHLFHAFEGEHVGRGHVVVAPEVEGWSVDKHMEVHMHVMECT
jgi:hypothetical protein